MAEIGFYDEDLDSFSLTCSLIKQMFIKHLQCASHW